MIPPVSAVSIRPQTAPLDPAREAALRETAQSFEAAFIAQLLTHAGLAKALGAEGGFGGDAFSGLLVEQYANGLADSGGIGLAEDIYQQLRDREALSADKSIA